jgi:L-rhamnose mutarotase
MPRVILNISYDVYPEKREEYLILVKELKDHLFSVGQDNYSVFEQKGKKDHFSEVYIFDSMDSFDHFEDDEDGKTEGLFERLVGEFVKDGKMKYVTLLESV